MHIPKTAGTSLGEIIKKQYGDDRVITCYDLNPYLVEENSQYLEKILDNQPNTKAVIGHFMYGIHKRLSNIEYKYITFLRDPLARILSQYAHHYVENLFDDDVCNELMLEHENICNYLDLEIVEIFYNNLISRYIGGYGECDISAISEYEILEVCKSNIEKNFIFVGRQEKFSEDILKLGELLKWEKTNPQLPNANTRGRINPSDIFTNEEILRLTKLNNLDCLLLKDYGYNFCASEIISNNANSQSSLIDWENTGRTLHKLEFVTSLRLSALKTLRKCILTLDKHSQSAQKVMDHQQTIIEQQQIELEQLKAKLTNTYET
jgi:hypothetical protein